MPRSGPVRGLYTAGNGDLYAVCYDTLYWVDDTFTFTALGTIAPGTTPVSMADNGTKLVLVDGTTGGYVVDLATRVMFVIDPALTVPNEQGFYGADKVDYIDTFFVLNKPQTPIFYCSGSEDTTFDPLDFASKVSYADGLITLVVVHSEIWLLGRFTTEIFYNSGGQSGGTFPFERIPNTVINMGCAAKYSAQKAGEAVIWLSRSLAGHAMVVMGQNTAVNRISTHAIEVAINGYSTIEDAIGMIYQQQGHAFYVLTFPTADKTWVFDISTGFWHERCWLDTNDGVTEHRHRMNCVAFAYDKVIIGDWENANIYALDPTVDTDNGAPMKFLRSFPHMLDDGRRMVHNRFVADIQVGDIESANVGLSLRWSDTRGATWNPPVLQTFGAQGDYYTSVQWRRLGMARDRVYELSWTSGPTALQGAWIDTVRAGT